MNRKSERSQCIGKIKHSSRARAKSTAKRMGNLKKGRLNVYRCPWCNAFHVGRVPNRDGYKTR